MRAPPEWIERWLEIALYGEKCERHPLQYKTFCCAACMEHLVCRYCWKHGHSNKHCGDRHPVLEVRKASNREAILVRDMREFMEVSDIQVYSFNRKRHLHLTPKTGASIAQPHCKTCGRKLITSHYNFCSIACKVHYGGGDLLEINEWEEGDEVESEGSSKASEIDSVDEDDEGRSPPPPPSSHPPAINTTTIKLRIKTSANSSSLSAASLRRRRRKGIPHRAPLQ